MIYEWDQAKSDRNDAERHLPFDLALALFDGPTLQTIDSRRTYGEIRVKALGAIRGLCMVCVFTDRGEARRIISLRLANRRERHDYRAAYPS
jgi:uncharacterized DUF497 family protein